MPDLFFYLFDCSVLVNCLIKFWLKVYLQQNMNSARDNTGIALTLIGLETPFLMKKVSLVRRADAFQFSLLLKVTNASFYNHSLHCMTQTLWLYFQTINFRRKTVTGFSPLVWWKCSLGLMLVELDDFFEVQEPL